MAAKRKASEPLTADELERALDRIDALYRRWQALQPEGKAFRDVKGRETFGRTIAVWVGHKAPFTEDEWGIILDKIQEQERRMGEALAQFDQVRGDGYLITEGELRGAITLCLEFGFPVECAPAMADMCRRGMVRGVDSMEDRFNQLTKAGE